MSLLLLSVLLLLPRISRVPGHAHDLGHARERLLLALLLHQMEGKREPVLSAHVVADAAYNAQVAQWPGAPIEMVTRRRTTALRVSNQTNYNRVVADVVVVVVVARLQVKALQAQLTGHLAGRERLVTQHGIYYTAVPENCRINPWLFFLSFSQPR